MSDQQTDTSPSSKTDESSSTSASDESSLPALPQTASVGLSQPSGDGGMVPPTASAADADAGVDAANPATATDAPSDCQTGSSPAAVLAVEALSEVSGGGGAAAATDGAAIPLVAPASGNADGNRSQLEDLSSDRPQSSHDNHETTEVSFSNRSERDSLSSTSDTVEGATVQIGEVTVQGSPQADDAKESQPEQNDSGPEGSALTLLKASENSSQDPGVDSPGTNQPDTPSASNDDQGGGMEAPSDGAPYTGNSEGAPYTGSANAVGESPVEAMNPDKSEAPPVDSSTLTQDGVLAILSQAKDINDAKLNLGLGPASDSRLSDFLHSKGLDSSGWNQQEPAASDNLPAIWPTPPGQEVHSRSIIVSDEQGGSHQVEMHGTEAQLDEYQQEAYEDGARSLGRLLMSLGEQPGSLRPPAASGPHSKK